MENILIASLGESPIVVTSMVKALKEKEQISINKVILLYPEQQQLIKDGVGLIKAHCMCENINEEPLPFQDANTEKHCFLFLQTLYGLLEAAALNNDKVYLSIAGGRKSMSSLMGLLAPFYSNIKGVYHILDKYEGIREKENFHSIETLSNYYYVNSSQLSPIMNPPLENLNLVEIPCEHFANSKELRRILKHDSPDQPLESTKVSLDKIEPEALEFWQNIFQNRSATKLNEIWLSKEAKEQFNSIDGSRKDTFSSCFKELRDPIWANKTGDNGGKHGTLRGNNINFYIAKKGGTAERVCWYQDGNKIVVAELGVEQANRRYRKVGASVNLDEAFFNGKGIKDYQPVSALNDVLPKKEGILLSALGKSPMVITQAYTLLKNRNVNINTVVLIYPKRNGDIGNGVKMLKDVFNKECKIKVKELPLKDLKDIDSTEACKTFLETMVKEIDRLRGEKENANSEIHLLLSGGRKGMSLLSLLAAQRSNIKYVYHTLITDYNLEKDIEDSCSLDSLRDLITIKEKVDRMFLRTYDISKFELFEIPVIPFSY